MSLQRLIDKYNAVVDRLSRTTDESELAEMRKTLKRLKGDIDNTFTCDLLWDEITETRRKETHYDSG